MKFGKVARPDLVDFSLPETAKGTAQSLGMISPRQQELRVAVGCAQWNRNELKGFYPRGTKDELRYYSKRFNSVELNATFYKQYPREQFEIWREKTPEGFLFFPKLTQEISHWKQLSKVSDEVNVFLDAIGGLGDRLGTVFLQLHPSFSPDDYVHLAQFITGWPQGIPLAVELRNERWYTDEGEKTGYRSHFRNFGIGNILVDTAGRRDMLHMELTNKEAFIRFVGANHPSDYDRLDAWVHRILAWSDAGLEKLDFFIHQNVEEEVPMLANDFIEKLNQVLHLQLTIPKETEQQQLSLF